MPKLTGSTKRIATNVRDLHKKDPKLSLEKISTKLGVDKNQARTYFLRHFGKTFTQQVKESRLEFIKNNQNLTNEQLCEQLGIVKSTLSFLIKDLKSKGKLNESRLRTTQKSKPPVAYKLSAFEVMRMLRWGLVERGFSVPELKQILGRSPQQIRLVLDELISNKLVLVGEKIGQRQHYFISPKGRKWTNDMELTRIERDREHLKSPKGKKTVLERKERELDAFLNLRVFAESKELIQPNSKLGVIIGLKQKEVSKLRLELYGKTR